MCDQKHFDDDIEQYSRRDFHAMAAAALGAAVFPQTADAVAVTERDVVIETPDGKCDAYFVTPSQGKHPAVLVWPDIFGLRPAFKQMGKRLAESGYSVLTVNPFYRKQKAPTATKGAQTPIRDVIPLYRSLNSKTNIVDAKAFVAWLDSQEQVDTKKKIGTTGYCMGGPIVMRTAGTVPKRIAAAATFHGGGLWTDAKDSPHLMIPKSKAQFLIAVAENDDKREPDTKDKLKKAFTEAKLTAEVKVFPAGHGWCPPDTRVHNKEQAELAWAKMLKLFKKALA